MIALEQIGLLVRNELLKVSAPGTELASIGPESRLIEDLGLDSLKFVDLTVGLEDALQLREFPMQTWVDDTMGEGQALTVGRLISACRTVAAQG